MDDNTPQAAMILPEGRYFSGWHPLGNEWLEALAPDIRELVQYAQACLRDNGRGDHEIIHGLEQIKAWRQAQPELVDHGRAPAVVFDEDIGTRLRPGLFAGFLLEQPALALKPYEFAALALLKEAQGLSELEVVARKGALFPAIQHITFKIARFYIMTLLLRMSDASAGPQADIHAIMAVLLATEGMQAL